MIARSLAAAALVIAFATPALAFNCPADVKAIDNALAAGIKMSTAQKAEVQGLRDQGEAQHKAGQHKEAVGTLAKAMRTILNAQ